MDNNSLIPDYIDFFGLQDHPFKLTPDTNYFFPSTTHKATYEILKYGLLRNEGFIIITGVPGSGKTLLLRLLLKENLNNKEFALLLSSNLTPKELLFSILFDLNITNNNYSIEYALRIFYDYLLNIGCQNKKLVIIVDEAQNLSFDTLEELRLLSNFETETFKLLQIILVGQPSLSQKLYSEKLYQLRQRITIWEEILPLNKEETLAYITFRWQQAGGGLIKIERGALNLLYRASGGIPRQINKIMDRAALFAAAERKKFFSKKILEAALENLKIPDKGFWGRIKSYFYFKNSYL